jgi:hypothetical protein
MRNSSACAQLDKYDNLLRKLGGDFWQTLREVYGAIDLAYKAILARKCLVMSDSIMPLVFGIMFKEYQKRNLLFNN